MVGFWLMHCFGRPGMVAEPLEELFGLVESGELRVVEGEVYGLSEARRAHEEMQARRTSGKLLLDPSRVGVRGSGERQRRLGGAGSDRSEALTRIAGSTSRLTS